MKWICVTLNTLTSAEDLVSSAVISCGVTGIQIENNVPPSDREMKAMFNDILPETAPEMPPDDGSSRIMFYLRIHDDDDRTDDMPGGVLDDSYMIHDRIYSDYEVSQILDSIGSRLKELRQYADIGPGTLELSVTSDKDWIDNWKQFYEPVRIGNILILPEWMDIPDEMSDEISEGSVSLIRLNPGSAFGTGSHETTKLAVLGLQKYLNPGDRVLDIGTGSGILGLCALIIGASHITATEIDSGCVSCVEHNLNVNGFDSSVFSLHITNLLDPLSDFTESPCPVVTANILSPVIIALAAPGFADRFTSPGGVFITSGLAASREDEVLRAFTSNPSWQVIDTLRMNDWISIIARKRM
jgi:ribosomal protein L11 methyltransferase